MEIRVAIAASCLFAAFALQSCIEEKDLYQAPPTTYSELNLKIDGDYTITELPIARGINPSTTMDETKTLLGIAISMTPKEGTNPPSKPYAYGIFQLDKAKNPDNLKIRVIDGYSYRISCSMIANAKDSIKSDENNGFSTPFDLDRNGTYGKCLNKFYLAEDENGTQSLINIENSKIATKNGIQNSCTRPFIERYHGVIDKLSVTNNATNTIKLYRRFFGVRFRQTGLTDGRLRIEISEAPTVFLYASANGDIHETMESKLNMICMKNLTANVPTENNQYLTENIEVKVFWERAKGGSEEVITKKSISFKRNFIHTITFTNIDHIGTPGNIGIQLEEGEMGEDPEQDIPWQEE